MNKISTENAEHYKWGHNCDGWHLLRSDHLSVIQERMPPGTSEIPHYHDRSRQFFYVISGQLHIDLEGAVHTLEAKEGLEIRPKSKHRVYNSSASEALFLVISSPPSHGDRIQTTRDNGVTH